MSSNNTPPHAPAGNIPLHAVRTPPESPTHLPATLPISPPATLPNSSPRPLPRSVQYLYRRIQECYQGKGKISDSTWERFRLSPKEYLLLRNELGKDADLAAWIDDKLRYDYDSLDKEFVLRMPAGIHDIVAFELQVAIKQKLNNLKEEEEELRPVVEQIGVSSTSDIQYDPVSKDKKSPDGSFYFCGVKFPTLIIEVANSQKSRYLPRLAESYMARSDGETKTVIAIDMEYRDPSERADRSLPPPPVLYSIYRDKVLRDEQTGDLYNKVSVDVNRKPLSPGGSMHLFLSDFCPEGTPSVIDGWTIDISHAELEAIVAKAEEQQRTIEGPRTKRKRKRVFEWPESPSEKLRPEDEKAYKKAEKAASDRASAENSSFSSADVTDIVAERPKRVKTRSQPKSDSDEADVGEV